MAQLEAEGQVVAHAHVGVEGVTLEDHGNVAVLGGQVVDHPLADEDGPGGHLFEPRDHAQGGRLAAAAGPHQHEELLVLDGQREVVDGDHLAEAFGDAVEGHGRHLVVLNQAQPRCGAGRPVRRPS